MITNEKTAEVCWSAIHALMDDRNIPVPAWNDLDDWHQELQIDLVRRIRMGATPEQVHAHWSLVCTGRGVVYDEVWTRNRSHPWLLPWAELDDRDRLVFKLICQMVLAMTLDYLADDGARPHTPSTGDLPGWAASQRGGQ